MLPRLLNIGRTQNGLFEMSAAMLGALLGGGASNVISGLLGSSASSNAATQAAEGQANALSALLSGEQTSQTALSPYYTGGLTDYDTLQYLLGTGGTGGTATWTDADQQQMNQLQASIQGFIGGSNASAKAKYADVLANYQQQYNQLALQKQQYQAQQAAQTAAQGTGLPSGYLTNIPSFNFNLNDSMTSGTGSQMLNLAMQQIQAQQAASGGFGSGNQATALANYIGGTYEPTLYNQAYQTYQTNQIDPRELIYGMLTGNTGGSGQSTANTLANLYTGTSSEAGQSLSGIGNAYAQGTLGSANALTSMLTGLGTGATGGMGNMYLNYLGNQNLVNALGQNSGMSNLYSSPVNASSALWL